jgi:[protein-PII] uridylyltransferase
MARISEPRAGLSPKDTRAKHARNGPGAHSPSMGADAGASFYRRAEIPFAVSAVVDEHARAFVSSMPAHYREVFEASAAVEHAEIVSRRGAAGIHLEAWKDLPEGGVCVCVVAEDGPGLLALLSAAFIAHEIDVVAGHAFCRTLDTGNAEAVDFFWLRRADESARGPTIDAAEVAELRARLVPLWGTPVAEESLESAARAPRRRLAPTTLTHVSFSDSASDGGFVLTVQTHDRPGLLFTITRTLFHAGLRISRSEVRTRGGVVCDRFHLLEADGSPVSDELRRRVQADVHASVASLASARPAQSREPNE